LFVQQSCEQPLVVRSVGVEGEIVTEYFHHQQVRHLFGAVQDGRFGRVEPNDSMVAALGWGTIYQVGGTEDRDINLCWEIPCNEGELRAECAQPSRFRHHDKTIRDVLKRGQEGGLTPEVVLPEQSRLLQMRHLTLVEQRLDMVRVPSCGLGGT
jgi:hypothetical protein